MPQPRSQRRCTNEATPCGESPDGTTPRIQTPRGESPDGTTPRIQTATRPRHPRVPTATRPRQLIHRITVGGMCCEEGSLMKSEWGMRGALVHLHPSRPDDSPPSVVRRHHKHENADEHSASSMSPHILPALCLTNMFRNTRTCRVRHSDIDMFLNTRRCCSEGGMRGALVHLHPTRPRVSNRDRGHLRGALRESDRILHERLVRVSDSHQALP